MSQNVGQNDRANNPLRVTSERQVTSKATGKATGKATPAKGQRASACSAKQTGKTHATSRQTPGMRLRTQQRRAGSVKFPKTFRILREAKELTQGQVAIRAAQKMLGGYQHYETLDPEEQATIEAYYARMGQSKFVELLERLDTRRSIPSRAEVEWLAAGMRCAPRETYLLLLAAGYESLAGGAKYFSQITVPDEDECFRILFGCHSSEDVDIMRHDEALPAIQRQRITAALEKLEALIQVIQIEHYRQGKRLMT